MPEQTTGLRRMCSDAWWGQLETARTEWQTILQRCAFPAEPMLANWAAIYAMLGVGPQR